MTSKSISSDAYVFLQAKVICTIEARYRCINEFNRN